MVENNHESIISQELWDKCREVDASVSVGKSTKEKITRPLSELCYYDSCGAKMKQHYSSGAKAPYGYVCRLHACYGKSYCTSHYIVAHALESTILADIQRQVDFVMNDDKAREKYLAHKREETVNRNHADRKRQKDIEKHTTDLDKLIRKIYEDSVLGNMPEKTCSDLLGKYQQKKTTLQTEIQELTTRAKMEKQDERDVDEFIKRLKKYAGAEQLTCEMCFELIEYVTVDELTKKQENPLKNPHLLQISRQGIE